MVKIVAEVKPVTENLPQHIQDIVAGFNAAASQEPRKGLSMKLPESFGVSLASDGASNNVPSVGTGPVREI